jgi:redox-sensing transcriptional repressor
LINIFSGFVKGLAKLRYSKISGPTIRRLSRYYRCLEELEEGGEKLVSSAQLATKCMVNPEQVRKDLNYFGEFGTRGVGYDVKDLLYEIKRVLGLNKEWRIAVIGIGDLGSSLLAYKDFLKQGYKIVAAFDIDPSRVIGRVSEKLGKPVEILHISRIKKVVKERKIQIGLITTPASEAQAVADLLVEAEVRGILNFAPTQITVPEGYVMKDVFFTTILDNLAYLLSNI